MGKRNLNLGTDFIENSDEPMQFPEDTMTPDELMDEFEHLGAELSGAADPELAPVTREDARHMALACAIIQTYPDTKNADTEELFLRVFSRRICAEYPKATSEDLEWAKKQLRYLREKGLSDETLNGIADLTMAELLALE